MTGRALGLVLLPVALLLGGTAVSGLAAAAGLALVALVAACALDRRMAPGAAAWRAVRHHQPLLSIGVANPVDLVLRSVHPHPTRIVVRDEAAPDLEPAPMLFRTRLPGWGEARCRYTLLPHRRGRYRMGRVVVRACGPLGLWTRQVHLPLAEEVRVYPDLTPVRAWDDRRRRGEPAIPGMRRVRWAGQGVEFRGVREQVDGDDFRLVNWRATARMGRLMVTEHQPERAQTVWILVDCGRAMQGGIEGLQKLDHACNAALLFAHVAVRSGDRVGVLAFADRVGALLVPRPGPAQFRRTLELLFGLRAGAVESDPALALARWRRLQGRRALAVLFTDVADPAAAGRLDRALAGAQPRHLVLVVTQRDPVLGRAAWAPPASADAVYQRAAALATIAERDRGLEALRHRGWLTVDSTVSALAPSVVSRYLELKTRGRL
ncbi:MAG TPA: DUF58 domain-containing protein [Candidatus Micrarchaeia archaeon]|nr:DUF58 domain-containing protein [Candidatus Micrarchaeia archaeon]